jgi:hypothetical protein
MSEEPILENRESTPARLRRVALRLLYFFVLLVPRFLALRRKPRVWLAIRVVLGMTGAALVIAPLGRHSGWITALIGLLVFLAAALLGSTRANRRVDERARELGAHLVVDGGSYEQFGGRTLDVRLFIASENVWVLDAGLNPLLVIPVREIFCARAGRSLSGWNLWIEWGGPIAEFGFEGFFAEHLARLAESAVRSVLRSSPAVAPRSQSSGA